MIKKNINIILIFFLTNCGFTPIYLKIKLNFSIEQVNYTGDRELNNFLKTNLNNIKMKKVIIKFILKQKYYKKIF